MSKHYNPEISILHLSDLHLISGNKRQKRMMNIVKDGITEIAKESPIDFVVFTGDLIFDGNVEIKEDVISTFNELIEAAGVQPDRVICCPGNHDIDQKMLISTIDELLACGHIKVGKSKEADKLNYVFNEAINGNSSSKCAKHGCSGASCGSTGCLHLLKHKIRQPFHNYAQLCERLHVRKPKFYNNSFNNHYTDGIVEFEDFGIRFLVFNSAWLCFGKAAHKYATEKLKFVSFAKTGSATYPAADGMDMSALMGRINNAYSEKGILLPNPDYGNLHLFVEKDMAEAMFAKEFKKERVFNVSLVHHPHSWLAWNERDTEQEDTVTFPYRMLAENSDMILSGHEHSGDVTNVNVFRDLCPVFSAGATYEESNNIYKIDSCSFSVLKIRRTEPQVILRKCYIAKLKDGSSVKIVPYPEGPKYLEYRMKDSSFWTQSQLEEVNASLAFSAKSQEYRSEFYQQLKYEELVLSHFFLKNLKLKGEKVDRSKNYIIQKVPNLNINYLIFQLDYKTIAHEIRLINPFHINPHLKKQITGAIVEAYEKFYLKNNKQEELIIVFTCPMLLFEKGDDLCKDLDSRESVEKKYKKLTDFFNYHIAECKDDKDKIFIDTLAGDKDRRLSEIENIELFHVYPVIMELPIQSVEKIL